MTPDSLTLLNLFLCWLTHPTAVVWKLAQPQNAVTRYIRGRLTIYTSLQMPTVERRVVCFPP